MGNSHNHVESSITAETAETASTKSTWMPPSTTVLTLKHSSMSSDPSLPENDVHPRGSRLATISQDTESTDTVSELTYSTIAKSARRRARHRRQQSSVVFINNGITGKYISSRIAKIAAKFWHQHVETKPYAEQLEIAAAIFFAMYSDECTKAVMQKNLKHKGQLELASMKYLDMMGWLIRYLITDNIDLYALLSKLGTVHQAMGVQQAHFEPMLQAMHETFAYYFGTQYTIDVKYALDEIFALASQVMTGQELQENSHLMMLSAQFQGTNIPFLESVECCLQSTIGAEYFYRYLQQLCCDEIVMFLKSVSRFKALVCDKERFMVVRQIQKACIASSGPFSLNLSYHCRTTIMSVVQELEKTFAAKEALIVPIDLFESVEWEVHRLLLSNHWNQFVESIELLQLKSVSPQ